MTTGYDNVNGTVLRLVSDMRIFNDNVRSNSIYTRLSNHITEYLKCPISNSLLQDLVSQLEVDFVMRFSNTSGI